jgi:hypothetical protein
MSRDQVLRVDVSKIIQSVFQVAFSRRRGTRKQTTTMTTMTTPNDDKNVRYDDGRRSDVGVVGSLLPVGDVESWMRKVRGDSVLGGGTVTWAANTVTT